MSRESDYRGQFSELMEAYAGPVRRLCGAYALSAADRDDLFQDIFLIGTALIGVWLYQERSPAAGYLLWATVSAGWCLVSVGGTSTGTKLDQRRFRIEQLLSDLT